jgi:hypothetical protein
MADMADIWRSNGGYGGNGNHQFVFLFSGKLEKVIYFRTFIPE